MGPSTDDPSGQPLQDQIEYYRSRAGEYDETAAPKGDPLAPQTEQIRRALHAFEPRGKVLEIACGTGLWTGELLLFADELIAIDAAPEMLEQARRKISDRRVRFAQADVFSWRPATRYDVVFFSFWLSHVPPSHFERFWRLVDSSLAPDGRVFFVDEGHHDHWTEDWLDRGAGVIRRRLRDGSEHRAVKVLWDPGELGERLRRLGWDIRVQGTGAFIWGSGRRSERP
jgi:SAM-dependent methyltransferase